MMAWLSAPVGPLNGTCAEIIHVPAVVCTGMVAHAANSSVNAQITSFPAAPERRTLLATIAGEVFIPRT
jgi:hypothetical protein